MDLTHIVAAAFLVTPIVGLFATLGWIVGKLEKIENDINRGKEEDRSERGSISNSN